MQALAPVGLRFQVLGMQQLSDRHIREVAPALALLPEGETEAL